MVAVTRAPVLVAVALIEYGMDALVAVQMIRERRFFNSSSDPSAHFNYL